MIETYPIPEDYTVPAPAPPPARRGLLLPFLLLLCGTGIIALAAVVEAHWVNAQPWAMALLVLDDDDEDIPPGAYEAYAYPVISHTPSDSDTIRGAIRRVVPGEPGDALFDGHDETAVAVVMPVAEAAPLLASGRLPRPGAREALAGDLAPQGYFTLRDGDGEARFEVVGRLRRTVSGFTNGYMIIDDPVIARSITPEDDLRWGWVVPDGWARMDELRPWIGKNDDGLGGGARKDSGTPPETQEDGGEDPEMAPMDPEDSGVGTGERPHLYAEPELAPLAPEELDADQGKCDGVTVVPRQVRTPAPVFWMTLAGLILVAAGGYSFTTRLCLRMAALPGPLLGPLTGEIARRPALWNALHALLYVIFFYAMIAGFVMPEANYQVTSYVSAVFQDGGDLGYIGNAYASRDVARAALATFNNNFIVQTLGMTFAVSLTGIPLGVVKTLGSVALAGLALSPVWVDGASGYTFHSVTMAAEFEGYLIACFAVLVWSGCVFRAIVSPGARARLLGRGIRVMIAAVFASGAVLAWAALYEAATLITLVQR